jgi:hypothetical protein
MIIPSDPAGVVVREGLVPKYLRPLAHVVVVPQSLAVLGDAVLGAVHEVLGLLEAVRLHDAVQKYLLVLNAGGFVLALRGTDPVIEGLEDSLEPSVESDVL